MTVTPASSATISVGRRGGWGHISKVIAKESVPSTVAGMFFQAVVATVLLYGSETWVVPPYDMRILKGFNIECCHRITRMWPLKPRRV